MVTINEELSVPGSLAVGLVDFRERWNDTVSLQELRLDDLSVDDPARRSFSRVLSYREPFLDERVENLTVTGLVNDDGAVRSAAVIWAPLSDRKVAGAVKDDLRAAFAHGALISAAQPGGLDGLEQSQVLVDLDYREDESFEGIDRSTVYRDVAYRLVDVGEREVIVLLVARSATAD